MRIPDFETFARMASEPAGGSAAARVVPVWTDCRIDISAAAAYARLRRPPFSFLLESAAGAGGAWARYSFVGSEPRSAWRLTGSRVEDWTPELGWHGAREPQDPLEDLESRLTALAPANAPDLGPFWSGMVGFFGYDVVRFIERLPAAKPRRGSLPDALFVSTRSLLVIDNELSSARLVVSAEVPPNATRERLEEEYARAVRELTALEARLGARAAVAPGPADTSAAPATGTSNTGRETFMRNVERIKEYIRAGDCFQALLSRRIDLAADFTSEALYAALRALNPSPYMYHLDFDGLEIVGSSPELLVRLADDRVTVRPIAGTRPRGSTAAEDAELSADLLADPKERAEHLMLVDLGRNDVGRVASYGTVEVTELMTIEKYSHVLHIVSQVEGRLRGGVSSMDVFRATFPAGTMTGAPKVRAMEIIDELETDSRGPYAGAVGYIAAGGRRMDLAITIRTCVIADGVASVQAGAGIVADSVPETEWDETERKAGALLAAIGQVRRRTES